jgi:hypothetical protein
MLINNIEHATNFIGTSVELNKEDTTLFAAPETLIDYIAMYSYPLSFIGAIMFTIIQIVDIHIHSMLLNKNLALVFNMFFIIWSLISMSVYYSFSAHEIPYLGYILRYKIPYILPFNPQVVITQL